MSKEDDLEDEDLIRENRDFFRDLARKGQERYALQWFRVVLLALFVIMILMTKGTKATLVIILLIGPLFFIMERLLYRSYDQGDWKTFIERDEFRYSPLQKLSRQIERASQGSQTQRAFVEERIKDLIIYRLANTRDVTRDEVERYVKDTQRDKLQELTRNETLTRFLLNATDINSLIKRQSRAALMGEEHEVMEKRDAGKGFREYAKKVIREVEDLESS